MPTQIIMPQLGESVIEGTVTRWLKREGEAVQEMESLLEVNTDKVDTEIPSPASGTLLKILVPEGETVGAGTIIAWVGRPDEALPDSPGQGGVQVPQAPEDRAPEVAEPGAGKSAEAIAETVDLPTQPVPVSRSGNGQPAQVTPGRDRDLGFISPIVARLAQEHQIDLTRVTGTGEGGRITKKDVLAYIESGQGQPEPRQEEAVPAPWETPGEGDLFRPTEMVFKQAPAPAKEKTSPVRVAKEPAEPQAAEPLLPGEGELIPHSPMRRKIAEHMVASKRTSPHVTTVMEVDLHRVVAHYNAQKQSFAHDGAKLTYTAYFVSAVVQGLRAFPLVNSSWTDEGIQIHPRIHIGLAVALGEEGLIVPVLKGADELSLLGLARAIGDIAGRARARQLKPEEVRGGTFTITNHGISGSLFATPVINQPQCAILGVGAIQKRVVVIEDEAGGDTIAIRPMAYLSLTFDHRILDGAAADGFLSKVVETLERWG